MSIWATVGDMDVPSRDRYTGEPNAGAGQRTFPDCAIDVATATSWNDCIRLSIYGHEESAETLLTVDEARLLTAFIQSAIERIRVNQVVDSRTAEQQATSPTE